MANIFNIIESPAGDDGEDKGLFIGIDLRIADQEMTCPVSEQCRTSADLDRATAKLEADLDQAREAGQNRLERHSVSESGMAALSSDVPPDAAWDVLAQISDETEFVRSFNALDEGQRKQIAEHVLTQCNVFQGRASRFAQSYDHATGRMA